MKIEVVCMLVFAVLFAAFLGKGFADGSRWLTSIGAGGTVFCWTILLAILMPSRHNRDSKSKDIARRTTVVTSAVIESHQSWTKDKGCFEVFTLDQVPYTFTVECSKFVVGSAFLPPQECDIMKVEFLRPKTPEGEPTVFKFQNLTQEIGQAQFVPPLAPEIHRAE